MSDKSETPEVFIDVYGNRAPRAAEFGKGATDLAGIREATEARRNARPGEYDKR